MDGNLARYRKIERPTVRFFYRPHRRYDQRSFHLPRDRFSPYVDLPLALLALVGYLCMANLVYITTSVKGKFKISYGSLGPTEARVIAMLANTFRLLYWQSRDSTAFLDRYISITWSSYLSSCFCSSFFFYTTITQAIEFERKDRAKLQEISRKSSQGNKSSVRLIAACKYSIIFLHYRIISISYYNCIARYIL